MGQIDIVNDNKDEIYRCDQCKNKFELDEDCFLGSLDGNDSCNPFMQLDCLCSDCYRKKVNEKSS